MAWLGMTFKMSSHKRMLSVYVHIGHEILPSFGSMKLNLEWRNPYQPSSIVEDIGICLFLHIFHMFQFFSCLRWFFSTSTPWTALALLALRVERWDHKPSFKDAWLKQTWGKVMKKWFVTCISISVYLYIYIPVFYMHICVMFNTYRDNYKYT